MEQNQNENLEKKKTNFDDINTLSDMFKDWYLDYASYVVLERAIPHLNDGFKPVQRRVLYSMRRIEDGRYNKVANIIGHTMQFHPHGDTSIGGALVKLGQKNLLIDTQGNWGNTLTGDGPAASRYIEARLTKFALDVVFNSKTTEWKPSYDGRNKEPVNLPVKFPLLLVHGVEGIGVGLASKILPHNFNEIIDASIAYLKKNDFELYPDFETGGFIDVSKYTDGMRGGKVRVRAQIEKIDKKTLLIKKIPFGQTTEQLIDSIIKANEKGKIKIKRIEDKTSEFANIYVHLMPGISPDQMIDALYAFTECETSISVYACVIKNNKPAFLSIKDILKYSVNQTVRLIELELKIRLSELNEEWHYSSLEKIFIENKIYRDIEECETWESILQTIDKGLQPFKKLLKREITEEDLIRLTELKIKRISKYDAFKADEHIKSIEEEIKNVEYKIENIINHTIEYFTNLKNKYGKQYPRKTIIKNFDNIEATEVVVANEKLYVNYEEGFLGTSLKKDKLLCECSDIDDVIIIKDTGKYIITKVSEKYFMGKDVIHVAIFRKNDDRTIYNVIYTDGKSLYSYMKRFYVKGITRDKEYDITQGNPRSRIIYFSANSNGEAEKIKIILKPRTRLTKRTWIYNFAELAIKSRNSKGNILTKHLVHKINLEKKGASTLGGEKIWFDNDINRLNKYERGLYLGEFTEDEKIIIFYKSGYYLICSFDIENHFEEGILKIEKFDEAKVYSVLYFNSAAKSYYVKRFIPELSTGENNFIGDENDAKLIEITDEQFPVVEIIFGDENKSRPTEKINVEEFISVKSFKAKGKKVSQYNIDKLYFIEPLIKDEDENNEDENIQNDDEDKDDNKNFNDNPLNISF